MKQTTDGIRSREPMLDDIWPDLTRAVSFVGDACVVQGSSDFDFADLNTVRHHFPDRHVTLDGDVITVWPAPRPTPSHDSSAQ